MDTEVDVEKANRDLEAQIETLRQKIRVEIELANFQRKQALECVTTERFFQAKEGGFIKGLPYGLSEADKALIGGLIGSFEGGAPGIAARTRSQTSRSLRNRTVSLFDPTDLDKIEAEWRKIKKDRKKNDSKSKLKELQEEHELLVDQYDDYKNNVLGKVILMKNKQRKLFMDCEGYPQSVQSREIVLEEIANLESMRETGF